MATLDIAQAAMTIGRPPETIERWILAGKVDAERAGAGWVVDMRSLLNAATAEDASANGSAGDQATRSPVQQPDDLGGRSAPPREATDAVAIAEPPPARPASEGPAAGAVAPSPPADPPDPAGGPAGAETRLAAAAPERAPPRPLEPTVEIASTAIAALSDRLEQAMSEIDRLHDERLKLALQLGYAQAQLKVCSEQLRALNAPPEPAALTRLLRWLLRRGWPGRNGA